MHYHCKIDEKLSRSADRLLQARRLYRAGKARRIIVSGGGSEGRVPEAELMAAILVELGVPAPDSASSIRATSAKRSERLQCGVSQYRRTVEPVLPRWSRGTRGCRRH